MNVDTVNRNLLWQAFPDGYLAMRGVTTVGGWTCWRTAEHDGKTVVATFIRNKVFGEVNCFGGFVTWNNKPADLPDTPVSSGDLLPNVDPADTATWACLLAELGRVAGLQEWRTLDFYRDGTKHRWMLWAFRPGSSETRAFVGLLFDTDDPALALVRALIQSRGEGAP